MRHAIESRSAAIAIPRIEDVLAIAMAKDPRRRFASARQLADAFIAARRGRRAAIEAPSDAWT